MSKWNKPNKQVSQEFLQNQERRKQMILQAAKRRKQKQRKLQQQAQMMKKQNQQAILEHKKSKQEAYVKYLRNNMHDKYQNLKRQENNNRPQVRSMSKWKKKDDQLSALALEVQPQKNQQKMKKHLVQEFEKEWQQEIEVEQMISSQLLDSLDLDFNTLARGQQINRNLKKKQPSKQIKIEQSAAQIKQLIGYESVLISIDQRKQLKQTKLNKVNQAIKNINKKIQKNQLNQGEAFIQLKNKKQGKILNWAVDQTQQADQLFSNCSSKRAQKTLKQINEQIKRQRQIKRMQLQPIPQKSNPKKGDKIQIIEKLQKIDKKQKNQKKQKKSVDKKNISMQNLSNNGIINNNIKSNTNYNHKQQNTQQLFKQKQKDVKIKQKVQLKTSKSEQRKNLVNIRKPVSKNKDSRQKLNKQETNQIKPFAKKPQINQPQYTIATTHQQLQIQSFIKNDLINLNQQEILIQQQIKKLHVQNKNKIKEIYQKHGIKTNYKNTKQINGQPQNNQYSITEDDIQNSIQRLDDLLIRKQIQAKKITQVSQPQSSIHTIINPFSNPKDFQQQILQLAENISRFDNIDPAKQPDINSYSYKNRIQKEKKNNTVAQVLSESKNIDEDSLSQMPQLSRPPAFNYMKKRSEMQQQKEQKIHVNAKLKNLLLQD